MEIHHGYDNLLIVNPVVTMGVFDGVHRGHRALLERLVMRAGEKGGCSAVITFDPHPRMVLGKTDPDMSLLTTTPEKTFLLEKAGIDHLIILDFSREFSNTGACEFVNKVLKDKIGTKHLIIGYDHRFGKRGEGDINTIRQCQHDFTVEHAEGIFQGNEAISSSSIREALQNGKLDEANCMLGYSYSLSGKVVEGHKIGRAFGFPTANIYPDNRFKLVPARGVYAVTVHVGFARYRGMLSIGFNPTINPGNRTLSIEVHIIDFDEDIYGRSISVEFMKRLRDERRFDNTVDLAAQMELDKQETVRLLS